MDLETVRLCFKKYSTYLENNEKIMLPENTNFDEISITEIDRLTQTMFMNYVMNNSQKVSPSELKEQVIRQTAVPCVLYKHMNSLIRQYIQEDHSKPCIKVVNIGNDCNQAINSTDSKKKGWIW